MKHLFALSITLLFMILVSPSLNAQINCKPADCPPLCKKICESICGKSSAVKTATATTTPVANCRAAKSLPVLACQGKASVQNEEINTGQDPFRAVFASNKSETEPAAEISCKKKPVACQTRKE